MNKKILVSVFVVLLVIAASIGATMAWFTDESDPIENVFTAGTLIIDVREEFNQAAVIDETNVNPDDCFLKEFEIDNNGSKGMLVRMKFDELWKFDVQHLEDNWVNFGLGDESDNVEVIVEGWTTDTDPVDPNGFGLLNTASINNPVKWSDIETALENADWVYNDGYYYYNGFLPANTTNVLEFEFLVCFDGPGMDNRFQAVEYKLIVSFEAIQASNNASGDLWDVDSLYDPVDPETSGNWDSWDIQ